jgi:acetyltransferase-like isoleucine patch superfamily enzyme
MRPLIRNRRGRILVAIVTLLLPWALKRPLLNWLLGYQLDPNAWIGFSIVAVASARIGSGARIGHLTVCRGLTALEMGDYGQIGNLNWITGNGDNPMSRRGADCDAEVILSIGAHSAITNRHYIDCSDCVRIGAFTTIAGIRSQLLTHSIELESCRQQTQPVAIGDYCFVGTGCIILPGAGLPDYSVLAAGSILRDQMDKTWTLYAGAPAEAKRAIPKHYSYFHRSVGFVR